MKIAVVDDHDLVREGMTAILASRNANNVTKFSTAMGLVSQLEAGAEFDFYIIDLELPDLDGFVLIKMIRARNPVAPVRPHQGPRTTGAQVPAHTSTAADKPGNSGQGFG